MNRSSWIAALVLFAVGVALYARTLDFEFVDWDDPSLVVDNRVIREASVENLRQIWTGPIPLQATSFLFDYAIWELDPYGYHLHSVLLNALVGALAFVFLCGITRREVAFVAALLFVVHSSHVESVAWVSARKELTFTAFLLLSGIAYQRARRDGGFRVGAYLASVVAFLLGVAAKTTVIGYPLFFLMLDWVEDRRLPAERRRPFVFHAAAKLPYLVLAVPLVWTNFQLQPTSDPVMAGDFTTYVLERGQAAWRYLWVLGGLWQGQPIYDPPADPIALVWLPVALAPIVLPVVVSAVALRLGYGEVALAFAWFVLGMIPPLVFPLTTYMADRYLYAPSLGFTWVIAIAIARVSDLVGRSRLWKAAVATVLVAPLLVWFGATAWRYTWVWRNTESLWTYGTRFSRDGRAATALSGTLIRQERLEEAERVLVASDTLPANGYLHLAIVYLEQNRPADALRATGRASKLGRRDRTPRSDLSKLMWVRGAAFEQLGRDEEAMDAWSSALVLNPENVPARVSLDAASARARARAGR